MLGRGTHGSCKIIDEERGVIVGYRVIALSITLISTNLISDVAKPDPAVIPLTAMTNFETTLPILTTLPSRYVAMDSLRSHRG